MRVTILGASGFIGRHLSTALRARGDDVLVASLRDLSKAVRLCEGADVVVNLAGEPVSQRWTPEVKDAIAKTRIDLPHALIDGIVASPHKPGAYVSASAIGYYGTSEDATFTEASPPGGDFLAQVCVGWEREARVAEEHGIRVAIVRTGLVLGADGGALERLLPIYRLALGGPIASGRQWYSWIHIDDQVGIYLTAIDEASGVLNATAPNPARNAEFNAALGRAVHRPEIFPVPEFAMKMLFGEGAIVVTQGQRVLPERTLAHGYTFAYPTIDAALARVVGGS